MQRFTTLPLGGGVLFDTVTLEVAECDEAEADLVARGLEGSDAPEVHRMMGRLQAAGWRPTVLDRR